MADSCGRRPGALRDRDGRGQLPERLHLPDPLAEERDLAGVALPALLPAIAARDNIPIVGWIALRGECRSCGGRIAARYPLVEALVGLLFASVYVIDVVLGPRTIWGEIPASLFLTWLIHAFLVALLVAATFIDYDLTIIPD